MKTSFLLPVLFILLTSFSLTAQKTREEAAQPGDDLSMTGTLEQRPWAKTGESYCAQGSDYLVFVQEGTEAEWVTESMIKKNIDMYVDKKVKVKGDFYLKVIEPDPDPMSQKPVSFNPNTGEMEDAVYECTIFLLKAIEEVK